MLMINVKHCLAQLFSIFCLRLLYVHCVCVVVNGEIAVQDDKLAYCAGEFIAWYSVKVNRIYLL